MGLNDLAKREFNIRFLLAAQCYSPKLARQLIRDCREDIKKFGWAHAQEKWARFVEKAQGGEEAR